MKANQIKKLVSLAWENQKMIRKIGTEAGIKVASYGLSKVGVSKKRIRSAAKKTREYSDGVSMARRKWKKWGKGNPLWEWKKRRGLLKGGKHHGKLYPGVAKRVGRKWKARVKRLKTYRRKKSYILGREFGI